MDGTDWADWHWNHGCDGTGWPQRAARRCWQRRGHRRDRGYGTDRGRLALELRARRDRGAPAVRRERPVMTGPWAANRPDRSNGHRNHRATPDRVAHKATRAVSAPQGPGHEKDGGTSNRGHGHRATGPSGPSGPQGVAGNNGAIGATGATGPTGAGLYSHLHNFPRDWNWKHWFCNSIWPGIPARGPSAGFLCDHSVQLVGRSGDYLFCRDTHPLLPISQVAQEPMRIGTSD